MRRQEISEDAESGYRALWQTTASGQTQSPDRQPATVRSWRLADLPGPAIAKQHSGASFVRLDRTGGK